MCSHSYFHNSECPLARCAQILNRLEHHISLSKRHHARNNWVWRSS